MNCCSASGMAISVMASRFWPNSSWSCVEIQAGLHHRRADAAGEHLQQPEELPGLQPLDAHLTVYPRARQLDDDRTRGRCRSLGLRHGILRPYGASQGLLAVRIPGAHRQDRTGQLGRVPAGTTAAAVPPPPPERLGGERAGR